MRLRTWVCLLAFAELTTTPARAAGAPGFSVVDARSLRAAGDVLDPCAQIERRQPGEPETVGVRFELARCLEESGRTASAWRGYLAVAAQAKARGDGVTERAAAERVTAVAPQLVRVKVDVEASATNGLALKRNGAPLQHVEWGVAVPVDPGSYTFEASAPGRSPWSTTVVIGNERRAWSVQVPELEAAEILKNGLQIARPMKPRGAIGVASVATLAVGAIALGAGAYFGIRSLDQGDEARAHCLGSVCDPRGVALRRDAVQSRSLATGAVAVGGGLVLVGALIWLLTPSRRGALPPAAGAGEVRLLPGLGRFDIRGTF